MSMIGNEAKPHSGPRYEAVDLLSQCFNLPSQSNVLSKQFAQFSLSIYHGVAVGQSFYPRLSLVEKNRHRKGGRQQRRCRRMDPMAKDPVLVSEFETPLPHLKT